MTDEQHWDRRFQTEIHQPSSAQRTSYTTIRTPRFGRFFWQSLYNSTSILYLQPVIPAPIAKTMNSHTTPPPPGQHHPAEKKKMHPLGWVGIGCGGILILAVIAGVLMVKKCTDYVGDMQAEMAHQNHSDSAEKIVELSPGFEMASNDPEAGEMTLRLAGSGETATFPYEEIVKGNVTITRADGGQVSLTSSAITEVPAWVPRYPKVETQNMVVHTASGSTAEGVICFTTLDDPSAVTSFYETSLAHMSGGSSSSFSMNDMKMASKSFSDGGDTLNIDATKSGSGEPTQVTVTYEGSMP